MNRTIGIRHEDKYAMERRAAIAPCMVEKLIRKKQLQVLVQSSPKRIFTDDEYRKAGANIQSDLKNCPVIFGLKEIPIESLEAGKTYVFFSHVIKGQPYNMPMLKRLMDLGCSLIDYERIVDEQNKRLIFFGKFAGIAGMINTFWALGQRLRILGYPDNPFLEIQQAHKYPSLSVAKKQISAVGRKILERGLPEQIAPITIGFTGYGNVSIGAQEIANLLPSMELEPEELLKLDQFQKLPNNFLYKTVFRENHLMRHIAGGPFDLNDYYQHPENYESDFEKYIPRLSVLLNGMYWDARYPRIVTKDYVKKAFSQGVPKLMVIGDVTCDPNGSVEITHKGTAIDDPVFVYNPFTEQPTMGFEGEGLSVMAVDILPSELPRDASEFFSNSLENYIEPIAIADYSKPFEKMCLPAPLKRALIVHKGSLTPAYKYLEGHLEKVK